VHLGFISDVPSLSDGRRKGALAPTVLPNEASLGVGELLLGLLERVEVIWVLRRALELERLAILLMLLKDFILLVHLINLSLLLTSHLGH